MLGIVIPNDFGANAFLSSKFPLSQTMACGRLSFPRNLSSTPIGERESR